MSSFDPLYNENASCVKCGHRHARSEYRTPGASGFGPECPGPPPYILRTCYNCEYGWIERPLDQATPKELMSLADQYNKKCDKRPE